MAFYQQEVAVVNGSAASAWDVKPQIILARRTFSRFQGIPGARTHGTRVYDFRPDRSRFVSRAGV